MPALRFRFLGVPVEIQASFFVLMGALGLLTYRSLGGLVAWLAVALVAVLVHEAGHAIAFRAFGDHPSVVLHGGGGMTTGGDHGAARMIAVTAAGPAAGIALGIAVVLAAALAPTTIGKSSFVDDAFFLTIGLSLLNLVPMRGFDGGTILNGLVTLAIGRPAGAIGWMIGALTVLAIVIGALALGRVSIAIFVVIFVIINSTSASSLPALFGASSGAGSPAELLNLGRADEALAKAEQASRRNPNDRDAVHAYGAALLAMTRYAEAERLYDGLLEREPDDLRARSGRFVARRALGRSDEAAPDLAAVMERAPVGIVEIGAQFQALYRDGQYERGLELIRLELARPGVTRPEAIHLRMLEAAMESVAGYPEAALRHADELIAVRPDTAPLHEVAGLALIQLGRVEEGLVRARRALTGAPRHPELIETVGIAERLCGRPEVALPLLLQAATARPEMPRARAELALCFIQLGRLAEATAALETLPAWSMDDPTVLYARGCMLVVAGDLAGAAGLVERAAALRPALGWVARIDPLTRSLGLAAP